jgi:PAS domain S-box-containing protein
MPSPLFVEPPLLSELLPMEESVDRWETLEELRTLSALTADIANALSRSFSLRQGLHQCASALVHHLEAAFARIWTLNEKDNILELQASAGLYTHLNGFHSRIPVGNLKIGLIAQERKPHLTNRALSDPRVSDQDWARREGMVAFAGYPLLVAGRVIGVMALFSRRSLTSATLRALETVADSIANGMAHWRTVEALRASEERFALAVQGTAEGIWDWNVLTGDVYFSRRFKELLEYEEYELDGNYAVWESRLHPDDRERVLLELRMHLKERRLFQIDYRLRVKSGQYRWFHARGQALWEAAGRPLRMLGSIRDITSQKLGEARLTAAHEVTQILAEMTDVGEALPRILHSLCDHLQWCVGAFWRRDEKDDVLRLATFRRLPGELAPDFEATSRENTFKRGVGLPGRTWESRRAEWMEDFTGDSKPPRAAAHQGKAFGAIAFPILLRGQVFGVMEFIHHFTQKVDAALIQMLEDVGFQISRCMELQQEQEALHRHRQELAIAHQIQQNMFPKAMPKLRGFEIAGASEPATEAGGDYFDFIPLLGDHLLLSVGDVSGHGLGPALVAASARAYVRVLALLDITIERIFNLVNKRLVEDTDEEFMTLFLGVINPLNRSLIYYNAGHCPGKIINAHGEVRAMLSSSDLPLGIDQNHNYQDSGVVQLLPGDLLLIHSDGLYEAMGPDGAAFGMARVLETVCASRREKPAAIIANLFAAARSFSQGHPHDDMTAIVVKVAEAA